MAHGCGDKAAGIRTECQKKRLLKESSYNSIAPIIRCCGIFGSEMQESPKYIVIFTIILALALLPGLSNASSTCNITSNTCSIGNVTINSITVNSTGKVGKPIYLVMAFAPGCTHCEALNNYLKNLSVTYDLRITYINAIANQTTLTQFLSHYNVSKDSWDTVPILFVNNTYCVGDTPCEAFMSANIATFAKNGTPQPTGSGTLSGITIAELTGLALVDSVNPCAFAVLIFLLSTLFLRNPNERHKILLGGMAFALGIFAFYITVGVLLLLGIKSVLAQPISRASTSTAHSACSP